MNTVLTQKPVLCQTILRLKNGTAKDGDFELFAKELRALSASKDQQAIDGDGDRCRGVAQGFRQVLSLIDGAEEAAEYAVRQSYPQDRTP